MQELFIDDSVLLQSGIRVLVNMLLDRGATESEIMDAIGERAAVMAGLVVM